MKIVTRIEFGDRIIGILKCKACQSEMELQVKDCGVATHTDYSGDSEDYVYVYCGVCNEYQEVKGCKVTYAEVKRCVEAIAKGTT